MAQVVAAALPVVVAAGKWAVTQAVNWSKEAAAVYGPQKGVQAIAAIVEKAIPIPYVGKGLGYVAGYMGVGNFVTPATTTFMGVNGIAAKMFIKTPPRELLVKKALEAHNKHKVEKELEKKNQKVENKPVEVKKQEKVQAQMEAV